MKIDMYFVLLCLLCLCVCNGCTVNREDYNLNISICTQVRNECHLVYGWVMFHYLQGVNQFHIYLIDPSDCTEDILSDFVKKGIVKLHYFPESAYESEKTFFLNENMQITDVSTRPHYNKTVEECKEFVYRSTLTLKNKYKHSCQRASIFDCFNRHQHYKGLLGFIDVDEYMFSPNGTLPDAFLRLDQKDIYEIDGLIYGMGKQYRRQLPFDLLPVLHKRHIRLDRKNLEAFQYDNKLRYRNYARKSFYRMPNVLSGELYASVHDNARYDRSKVLSIGKNNGAVLYNHYMYKSVEEYVLSSTLTKRLERQVDPLQLSIYEEEHGSRMESLLKKFEDFFYKCEVPKIKALLQPRRLENVQWWTYGRRYGWTYGRRYTWTYGRTYVPEEAVEAVDNFTLWTYGWTYVAEEAVEAVKTVDIFTFILAMLCMLVFIVFKASCKKKREKYQKNKNILFSSKNFN